MARERLVQLRRVTIFGEDSLSALSSDALQRHIQGLPLDFE